MNKILHVIIALLSLSFDVLSQQNDVDQKESDQIEEKAIRRILAHIGLEKAKEFNKKNMAKNNNEESINIDDDEDFKPSITVEKIDDDLELVRLMTYRACYQEAGCLFLAHKGKIDWRARKLE